MRRIILLLLCLAAFAAVEGHEGHQEASASLQQTLNSIGKVHLLLLHFPIALIIMTICSECLYFFSGVSLFDQAARFMIIAAALFVIPTVMTGFLLSYGVEYKDVLYESFWWHRFFGLATALFTLLAATFRELTTLGKMNGIGLYYFCLIVSFITVSLAGFFGGIIAF